MLFLILLKFIFPAVSTSELDRCLVGNVKLVGITEDQLLDWRFKTLGVSNSLAKCAELCCTDDACPGALLYNETCYIVKCNEEDCTKYISNWPSPTTKFSISGKYMEISRFKKHKVENQLEEKAINQSIISKITENLIKNATEDNKKDEIDVCNSTHKVRIY